jgi:hypothetical protein
LFFFFFTFLILLNIFCYGFIEGDAIREIFYERKTRVHLKVIWMKSNLRKSKNPKVKLIFSLLHLFSLVMIIFLPIICTYFYLSICVHVLWWLI